MPRRREVDPQGAGGVQRLGGSHQRIDRWSGQLDIGIAHRDPGADAGLANEGTNGADLPPLVSAGTNLGDSRVSHCSTDHPCYPNLPHLQPDRWTTGTLRSRSHRARPGPCGVLSRYASASRNQGGIDGPPATRPHRVNGQVRARPSTGKAARPYTAPIGQPAHPRVGGSRGRRPCGSAGLDGPQVAQLATWAVISWQCRSYRRWRWPFAPDGWGKSNRQRSARTAPRSASRRRTVETALPSGAITASESMASSAAR